MRPQESKIAPPTQPEISPKVFRRNQNRAQYFPALRGPGGGEEEEEEVVDPSIEICLFPPPSSPRGVKMRFPLRRKENEKNKLLYTAAFSPATKIHHLFFHLAVFSTLARPVEKRERERERERERGLSIGHFVILRSP